MNECHICNKWVDIGSFNGKLEYVCLECMEINREPVLDFIRNTLGAMGAMEFDKTGKLNPKYNDIWQYIESNLK